MKESRLDWCARGRFLRASSHGCCVGNHQPCHHASLVKQPLMPIQSKQLRARGGGGYWGGRAGVVDGTRNSGPSAGPSSHVERDLRSRHLPCHHCRIGLRHGGKSARFHVSLAYQLTGAALSPLLLK